MGTDNTPADPSQANSLEAPLDVIRVASAERQPFIQVHVNFALYVVPRLNRAAIAIYLILRTHLNRRTGQCNPTYSRLRELTGLSQQSIASGIRELAALGVVRIDKYKNPNGQAQNWYIFQDLDERLEEVLKTPPKGEGDRCKNRLTTDRKIDSPPLQNETVTRRRENQKKKNQANAVADDPISALRARWFEVLLPHLPKGYDGDRLAGEIGKILRKQPALDPERLDAFVSWYDDVRFGDSDIHFQTASTVLKFWGEFVAYDPAPRREEPAEDPTYARLLEQMAADKAAKAADDARKAALAADQGGAL